ncbi:secretogranin-2a [Rhinoraja longicauda]
MAMLKTLTVGTMLTLSLLLNAQSLRAASLAPYRYDPGSFKENAYSYPDPNMVKALELIENLRQNNEDQSVADYDARGAPRSFQEPLFKKLEGMDRVNADADSAGDSSDEDRAEWAKRLLLQALVQAESQTRAYRPEARYYKQDGEAMDFGGDRQDYNDDEFSLNDMKDKLSRKHHVSFLEDGYNVNPYKRTNEIVEEQYTPQSLATLESAFRELGTYPPARKEQGRVDQEHSRKGEEGDVSRANDFVYEDAADGEDWNSIETKTRHRHRGDGEAEREPEVAGYNDKKSLHEVDLDHLDSREKAAPREMDGKDEMADAAMDLMLQYYKRLQGGQPGRAAGNAGGDRDGEGEKVARGTEGDIEPGLLDQLVELSSRFQIPPDDILRMLKDVEQKKQAAGTDSDSDSEQESSETGGRRDGQRFRDAHSRGRFAQHNAGDDLTTEDILNILGTGDRVYEKPDYFRKADPLKGRQPAPYQSLFGHRNHDWTEQDTGNRATAVDEDQLARYLERVVARNPELLRARVDEQAEADSYQDAVQEFLRGLSPREAAEVLSVANSIPTYTKANAYRAPPRQQKGEGLASMVLKLKELVNQQDRAAKESNIEQY